MVLDDALRPHRAELPVEPGPELLESHGSDANPRAGRGRVPDTAAYARTVIPGTGSATLDLVLQIGIIAALVVTIVLLVKNLRGR